MSTHQEISEYADNYLKDNFPLYSTLSVIHGCALAYSDVSADKGRNAAAPQGILYEAVPLFWGGQSHYLFCPSHLLPNDIREKITPHRELDPALTQWIPPGWATNSTTISFDIGQPVYFQDLAKETDRVRVPYVQSNRTQSVNRIAFRHLLDVELMPNRNPQTFGLRQPLAAMSSENCLPVGNFISYRPHADVAITSMGGYPGAACRHSHFTAIDQSERRTFLVDSYLADTALSNFQRGETYRLYGVAEIPNMENRYGQPHAVLLGGILGPLPKKVLIQPSANTRQETPRDIWVRVTDGLPSSDYRLFADPASLTKIVTEMKNFGSATVEVVRRDVGRLLLMPENNLHPMLASRRPIGNPPVPAVA